MIFPVQKLPYLPVGNPAPIGYDALLAESKEGCEDWGLAVECSTPAAASGFNFTHFWHL